MADGLKNRGLAFLDKVPDGNYNNLLLGIESFRDGINVALKNETVKKTQTRTLAVVAASMLVAYIAVSVLFVAPVRLLLGILSYIPLGWDMGDMIESLTGWRVFLTLSWLLPPIIMIILQQFTDNEGIFFGVLAQLSPNFGAYLKAAQPRTFSMDLQHAIPHMLKTLAISVAVAILSRIPLIGSLVTAATWFYYTAPAAGHIVGIAAAVLSLLPVTGGMLSPLLPSVIGVSTTSMLLLAPYFSRLPDVAEAKRVRRAGYSTLVGFGAGAVAVLNIPVVGMLSFALMQGAAANAVVTIAEHYGTEKDKQTIQEDGKSI